MSFDPTKQSQIETIELMAKNEEAVAALYKSYSIKFPYYKNFWINLSKDEITHANWIRLFLDKFKNEELKFNKNRFNKGAVKLFLSYLKNEKEKAEKGNINTIGALSVALDIEKSLIEKNFFEIMDSDSGALQKVLSNLASATTIHQKKVEDLLNKVMKDSQ